MPTEFFDPLYSTNTIYVGDDDTVCLTDELEIIETDITALETDKADTNHVHTEYAATDHVHTGYATSNHTYSYNDLSDKPTVPITLPANGGDADTVDGKHSSDFATVSDIASIQSLVGNTSVATQSYSAVAGKADTTHTHAITDVTGLSDQLSAKYVKPLAGIPKTDLASDI